MVSRLSKIIDWLKKSKKSTKILIVVASILAVLIIAAVLLYCIVIMPYYSDRIDIVSKPQEDIESTVNDTIDVELPDNPDEIPAEDQTKDVIYEEEQKEDEIINILLSGVDTRSYDLNSRSDTIILASYNKTQHTVKLVSFMRDSWVYLPERGWSRINAATVYGGTGLLINTINYNFDLDIQNYVQVKFDDFRKIIDIIGGIDVELTQQEINYINRKLHSDDRDWSNDITAEPGLVHLNGAQALWHCRNRSIGNSDYTRTERQREVIGIIIDKILSMSLGEVSSIVFELRNYVNTNIPMQTILELGYDAMIAGNIEVESSRVPFDGEFWSANKNGASVLELDIDANTALLHEFLGYEVEDSSDTSVGTDETDDTSGTSETASTDNVSSSEDDNIHETNSNTSGVNSDAGLNNNIDTQEASNNIQEDTVDASENSNNIPDDNTSESNNISDSNNALDTGDSNNAEEYTASNNTEADTPTVEKIEPTQSDESSHLDIQQKSTV